MDNKALLLIGFYKSYPVQGYIGIVNVTDNIYRLMSSKMNSIFILLDFSKAFDTINYELLIKLQ